VNKEYKRYGIIALVIIIFGTFIYPTLYRYDKLSQRYPVKINRITGHTEILDGMTWKSADAASTSEVDRIRAEINQLIQTDHDKLKQEVISETKDQIIQDLRDEINSLKQEITSAKASIGVFKKFQTDPNNYFTVGDTKETVKRIMGVPDSIDDFFNTWYYGSSQISFSGNKVKGWSNSSNNLMVK
jgi:hypothetical protein